MSAMIVRRPDDARSCGDREISMDYRHKFHKPDNCLNATKALSRVTFRSTIGLG